MKKTKKRCLSILSIVVLIILVFMPLASSITIKNYEEQMSDAGSISEDVCVSYFDKESTCGGTLYGYTVEAFDTWGSSPVPFALVDAGIKKTISGFPMGFYRITGLPFDQQIIITASKKGYNNDTLKHTFTEQKPTYYYCFDLQENEVDSVKEKVSNKNDIGRIYGTVFGEVGGFEKYIPFASIELVGIEKKRCGIQGGYEFKDLALG